MDIAADTALSASQSMTAGRTRAGTAALTQAGADRAAQRKAAENFETMFLSQMFGHMFNGIKSDQLFGGGQGEEMFRSLLTDEYAKQVVKKGGVGIADSVMSALIAQQEKA